MKLEYVCITLLLPDRLRLHHRLCPHHKHHRSRPSPRPPGRCSEPPGSYPVFVKSLLLLSNSIINIQYSQNLNEPTLAHRNSLQRSSMLGTPSRSLSFAQNFPLPA